MTRAVLITGCSSGIGKAAAVDLHARGYQVIATCRREEDVLALRGLGLTCLQLDLNESESIRRAVKEALILTEGKLYALFNNAGYGLYGQIQSVSRKQLELQFATNVFGMHELTQLLLPIFLQQGAGRIIQTSSVLGRVATPRRGAYCASKHALEAWSDALRIELYGTGIHVSLIEPGPIQTGFSGNLEQTQESTPVLNPPLSQYFALQAKDVLPAVRHALESPRPRLRYPVTMVTHIMVALKWLLPARWLDRLLLNN